MDLGLKDKVIFVTGASGGIGRALAQRFAEEGARLALVGHTQTGPLDAWVRDQTWAERALVRGADVADPEAVESAVAACVERFGRIDTCIACAGIWPRDDRLLHELPVERLRRTVEVNLLGATWTARAFFAAIQRSGPRSDGHGANLIFIGSTAGRFGERGHADYAASKAGLVGLLRTLKNEIVQLDPRGRVNLIEPGWTVTHMARPALDEPGSVEQVVATMPLRQLGRASDVAATAAWLASPLAARHVSGQVVTVAGGMEGRKLWSDGDIDGQGIRAEARSD